MRSTSPLYPKQGHPYNFLKHLGQRSLIIWWAPLTLRPNLKNQNFIIFDTFRSEEVKKYRKNKDSPRLAPSLVFLAWLPRLAPLPGSLVWFPRLAPWLGWLA